MTTGWDEFADEAVEGSIEDPEAADDADGREEADLHGDRLARPDDDEDEVEQES